MTTSAVKRVICAILLFLWAAMAPVCAQNAEIPVVSDDEVSVQESLGAELTVNVVSLVLNAEHRDGVDWSAIVSDFHSVALKKQDNPVWADKKYKLSVGTVSIEDYAVLLEALDTVGQMNQTPYPSFKIGLNEDRTEVLSDVISLGVQMTRQRGEDALLTVQPNLNLAKMMLKARTQLPIKDKVTIVIGGIFSEEEITKMHKFPLLGDLPLVGLVFRSRGHLIKKTETVIFLTINTNEIPNEDY